MLHPLLNAAKLELAKLKDTYKSQSADSRIEYLSQAISNIIEYLEKQPNKLNESK